MVRVEGKLDMVEGHLGEVFEHFVFGKRKKYVQNKEITMLLY